MMPDGLQTDWILASYMTRHGIHRVLVLEGDELIGIASAMDMVRAVAVGIL